VRLAFIGSTGHQKLYKFVTDERDQVSAVAIAPGGNGSDARVAACDIFDNVEQFDDPLEMMDKFKPDFVNVGAVYALNGDFVAAAMQRDIPVCSDKPIAASWPQYDRLAALAGADPGRIVVTEFQLRSRPAFRAARAAIAEGLIGQVVLATGQKSYRIGTNRPAWYSNRDQYGGTILWIASHAVDFIRFATGLEYSSVYGEQANISKPQYGSMEEVTVSIFGLENGGKAIVHADYNRPAKAPTHGDDRLRVVGSAGLVEVRDGRCMLMTNDQDPVDITGRVDPAEAHHEILAALRGKASDIYGTQTSLRSAKVLLHARDAADEGRVVTITG